MYLIFVYFCGNKNKLKERYMKTINERVLYFHDFMTDIDQTNEEIRMFQREFYRNDILINDIEETDNPPFRGSMGYDILLFDWGGASFGNSLMEHYCEEILNESIDNPNRIYVMVSSFTEFAMVEAMESFKLAHGSLPNNVFLDIKRASDYMLRFL